MNEKEIKFRKQLDSCLKKGIISKMEYNTELRKLKLRKERKK